MGEYEKAIKEFTHGIELNPRKSLKGRLYFARGLAYKELDESSKLKKDFEKAQSLESRLRDEKYVGKKRQGTAVW